MLRSFLIFLLIILFSTVTALATQSLTAAPAHVPEVTRVLPTETALAQPSPTAQPLPTSIVKVTEAPRDPAGPEPTQQSLLDAYMPEREIVAETDHFILYAQDGYLPVDLNWFQQQAEVVYAYVSRRLDGAGVKNKVELGFMPPDERACPVRGLASHVRSPMVLIYADEASPRAYILAVLAHELGHSIPSEGFPGGLPDDQALTEGLATWASGKYWAAWIGVPDLEDIVQGYIARGEYEPLVENVEFSGIYPWQNDTGEDCLARRDKIYAEWGVFLGYLIDRYGWDKAYRLFDSPDPRRQGAEEIHFPPDYEGIYGRSLNQLEYEWLRSLKKFY